MSLDFTGFRKKSVRENYIKKTTANIFKRQIRSTKSENLNNVKIQNSNARKAFVIPGLTRNLFWSLGFRICLGFRYSDFGFICVGGKIRRQ